MCAMREPALQPSTRYFWLVKVWDAAGKPYAESETSWWETGLLKQEAWRGQWIGYETPEEAAVRHAPAVWIASPEAKALAAEKRSEEHFAYRPTVTLDNKPVLRAALQATGQDTVSAWVNGAQVLTADKFPPWKQMPWKKFVRADVTGKLSAGANTIAIETVHYVDNHSGRATGDAPPMIATLVVEYADGTTATFASGSDWKTAVHAAAGWQQKGFDDAGWRSAVEWKQAPGPMSQPLGHPWIPDSVKILGQEFVTREPGSATVPSIKSARLYATALGAYEFFINGNRASDVLAPGWTDYREHVKYQSYDVTADLLYGSNRLWAQLAPGWYETPLEWFQQPNNYGETPPAIKAQLRIEYTDGSVQWVATDATWKAMPSYILHSEIYDGESQDLRKIGPYWNEDNFNIRVLANAVAVEPKIVRVESQDFQPISVEQTLIAKSMIEPKPGVYVYDFGQNFAGVEELRVRGLGGHSMCRCVLQRSSTTTEHFTPTICARPR